jgi:hypothetical protein
MGKSPDGFTRLTGVELDGTLGDSLICAVDCARDVLTELGLRPYEVHLIRTRWTGGTRGDGQQITVTDDIILPTPKIESLDDLGRELNAHGIDEAGSIRLSQVSGRYTEDFLLGRDPAGIGPAADEQFFYEVTYLTRGKVTPAQRRRRFTPESVPGYDPQAAQWIVRLARVNDDRERDGNWGGT